MQEFFDLIMIFLVFFFLYTYKAVSHDAVDCTRDIHQERSVNLAKTCTLVVIIRRLVRGC